MFFQNAVRVACSSYRSLRFERISERTLCTRRPEMLRVTDLVKLSPAMLDTALPKAVK